MGQVFVILINSPCLLSNADPVESWQAIVSAAKYLYVALKKACVPFQLVLNCCCKYDQYVVQNILPVYFPLSPEQKAYENTQLVIAPGQEPQLPKKTGAVSPLPFSSGNEDLFQLQSIFKYKPTLTQKQKLMKDVSEVDTADIKQFPMVQPLYGKKYSYSVILEQLQFEDNEKAFNKLLRLLMALTQDCEKDETINLLLLGTNYDFKVWLQSCPLEMIPDWALRLDVLLLQSETEVTNWVMAQEWAQSIRKVTFVQRLTDVESLWPWAKIGWDLRQWEESHRQ